MWPFPISQRIPRDRDVSRKSTRSQSQKKHSEEQKQGPRPRQQIFAIRPPPPAKQCLQRQIIHTTVGILTILQGYPPPHAP